MEEDKRAAAASVGAAIEAESFTIIDHRLRRRGHELASPETAVMRRIIHATADFSFARTMRFQPGACAAAIAAIRARRPLLCDVTMLLHGVTRYEGEALCLVHHPEARVLAAREKITRSSAALRLLRHRLDGAIVAIGNAPTALREILRLAAEPNGPRPAAIVGLPVGFVDAAESKRDLIASLLPFISNLGPRGGSPCAAAAINALIILARESAA
jgi:precorrin-8X/cobalt-precorrin-8 methylmutase